ncbi:glycosyltransferase family 4 protein [Caldimonas tepidiphila]|uniref:glycosyltransferase family 4 protein n=1 Tax=Caldimonas tepidiphila TaxID=2315841 RepID=UPI000E5C5562|nr:glycosyltransferase family 1 protein [Caldimonas tepidiphila]
MREAIHVGISLGNLGSLIDGLGEFSNQLCLRLAAQAPALREEHGIELTFHLRESLWGCFGEDVHYLSVDRWQRLRHVQPRRFALWHTLNQLNKTLPPQGTKKRLLTVHDLNFLYFKSGFSQWRNMRRLRARLAHTDHIVTISDYVRRDVQQHLQWRGPIEVIYNGARSLVDVPREAVPELQGRPFLFHLSRMSASKNIDALLALARHWPGMHFVFAGPEGRDSRAVREQVSTGGLSNVSVMLSISDAQKAWLYANCTAFLFPSLTEGFGLPPIEAMHFGKPVFLSERTCLPEIGGEVAAYFPDFEAPKMQQVVERNLPRLQAQSGKIRKHAARFDWDAAAQRYLHLYLQLTGSVAVQAIPSAREHAAIAL